MWFLTFLLVVLLDCVVFGVPVLVYRFAIRKGEPIQNPKKAFFINLAFFCAGTAALVIFNILCGVYEDPDYRFQLGFVDLAFMGLDYYLLTFKRKSESAQSKPKCTKCGAPLTETAKFCTECGDKVAPSGMIVCPSCGNTVTRGKFCPECGHKFVNDLQEPPQRTPSPYSAPSKYRDENAVTKVIKPGIETGHPSQPQGNDSPKAYSRVYVNSLGEINRESEPRPRKEDSAEEDVAKIAFICMGVVVVLIAIVVAVCMAFLN